VGYGVQKRKELTGSVASVDKTVLSQVTPIASIDNLLGGAVSGVNVTQSSGQPGATSTIRIRGANSISGGSEPLYVIDGLIVYNNPSATRVSGGGSVDGGLNPLASLNTADIESVEVLKDVSATAIYGSRGANGVIIVNTKSGKRGKGNINYSFTAGWSQTAKKLDLLNGKQWTDIYRELGGTEVFDETVNTDWQDEAFRTGASQNHQLSISGGDEKTAYLFSGNYTKQNGILINTGFERYSGRVNIDREVFKNLKVGVNASVSRSTQNGFANTSGIQLTGRIAGPFDLALRTPPVVPIYNSDGSYNHNNPFDISGYLFDVGNHLGVNPIEELNTTVAETQNTNVLGRFYAAYTIIPGLTAKINSGINLQHAVQNYYAPSNTIAGLSDQGYGSVGNQDYDSYQHEFTLNYNKQINDDNFIDALVGYTTQKTDVAYSTAISATFPNESLTYHNLGAGSSTTKRSVSGGEPSVLNSYLGRVNYSFKNRYNLTATLRADASSKFGKNHHWGYFPSVGLSWNVDEESFFPKSNVLNDLKFRLSTGTVGNQEIPNFLYQATYNSGTASFGEEAVTTYVGARLENPNLKWESTTQSNVGFDLGLLNNKLNIVFDAYYKETTDLLASVPVEAATGHTTQYQNIGSLTNKGLELGINGTIIERRNFRWTASANIAKNINKVTKLYADIEPEFNINLSPVKPLLVREGQPLGTFYGYVFDGIVQTPAEAATTPKPSWYGTSQTVQPGDAKWKNISDEDGANKISDKDKVILGNSEADFTYGFSSSFVYKRFDISVVFQGSQGNQLYNALRQNLEQTTKEFNGSATLANRWTPTNPSNTVPHALASSTLSYVDSRYIEDASYLRLKNITLGYTFPVKMDGLKGSSIKVFGAVQNLFTWTNYTGYDPEVSHNGRSDTDGLLQGVDSGAYPSARTFSIGISLTL
jgi:TonB-linked SusC/RagA family outer membrane protein